MRGAWANTTQAANGHWPDTYKKPNYPTFSNESKYATEDIPGGEWQQNAQGNYTSYTPSWTNMVFAPPEKIQQSAGMPVRFPAAMSDPMLGYRERQPFPSERTFFQNNPEVAGWAGDGTGTGPDRSIVINPSSPLSPDAKRRVAELEATRLHMQDTGYAPEFAISPQQQQYFNSLKNKAYANDPAAARQTIISRILAGDPSAYATAEQEAAARAYQDRIRQQFPAWMAPVWQNQYRNQQ